MRAGGDANWPRPGRDSYERTIAGIRRTHEALGLDSVSALMTTTRASLSRFTNHRCSNAI